MASIPLTAALVKPVEQPDALQNFSRLAQLRGLQQEVAQSPLRQQLLQQQVQQGQLQNEQAQQAMRDQAAFRAAGQDPNLKDKTLGGVAEYLRSKGNISLQGYQQLREADFKARADAQKLTDDQATALQNAYKSTQPIYDNVMKMDDATLQQNWPQIASQYDAIWNPIRATHPNGAQFPVLDPSQPMNKQQLSQFGPMLQLGLNYTDEDLKRREQAAKTTKAENEAQNGPIGPAAEAKYRFILQKIALKQPVSPEDQAFAQAFEASEAKNTTQADSLGVTSASMNRPAGLSSIRPVTPTRPNGSASVATPPANSAAATPSAGAIKNDTVDLIGQYRMDPSLLGRMLYKHPEMLGMIQAKYPDWDQTTYQAKAALIKGYTSGSQSKEINAINTAMGHVKVLDDAVNALNNGNLTALNQIGNQLGINVTGQTAPSAFKLIVHRVGPEIASAYIPGGGGEMERIANEKDFDENLPAQTLHNNAAITVKLLRSKVGSLENQYKNAVGRDDFSTRFITPEAQSAFQRFGGNQGGAQPQHTVGSFITQGGHKFKVTAVDANGKVTAADPVE